MTVAANAAQGSLANTATVATVDPVVDPTRATTSQPTRRDRGTAAGPGGPRRPSTVRLQHARRQLEPGDAASARPRSGSTQPASTRPHRWAIWNDAGHSLRHRQGAAFTFADARSPAATTPSSPPKASGGSAIRPQLHPRQLHGRHRRRSPRRPTRLARTPSTRDLHRARSPAATPSAPSPGHGDRQRLQDERRHDHRGRHRDRPGAGFWTGTGGSGSSCRPTPASTTSAGRPAHEPPDPSQLRPPAVEGDNVMSQRTRRELSRRRAPRGRRP